MKVRQEQDKHRHHKQPQFFLKGFAYEGSNPYQKSTDIWVYKKGEAYEKCRNPSLESVRDVGYEDDFYAFVREDGNTDFNKYENILEKDFEKPAQPILEKIRKFEEINNDEKRFFSRYVSSMVARGDWWKNTSERIFSEVTDSLRQELSEIPVNEAILGKIEQGIKELIEERQTRETRPRDIIERSEKLSEILQKMNWIFLIAPDHIPFLTSDNPVFYFHLDKSDGEVIFPISSKVTLLLSWKEVIKATNWNRKSESYWEVNDKTVVQIRDYMCSTAIKEVYFSKEYKWLVGFINKRIQS